MTTDFRIFCVTWNIGESGPSTDFTSLLALNSKVQPNMYAIGLQELKATTVSLLVDAIFDDPWTTALTECLAARGYARVDTVRLVGTHLAVYVRRADLPYITNVESTYTRIGLGGLWGSKGAVSIRMEVYGVQLCIINSHFTAHLENYDVRIADYSKVIEAQRFQAKDCETILDHDYVLWIGDLNFRIDKIANDEVRKRAVDRDFQYLWPYDQLNQARKDELLFIDFEEGRLNFPPTFKYDLGSNVYDTSSKYRVPSWCDRILWHVHSDAFTGVELSVKQERYTSLLEYTQSDHKPVVADFTLKVLTYPKPLPVMFEPSDWWNQLKKKKVPTATLR